MLEFSQENLLNCLKFLSSSLMTKMKRRVKEKGEMLFTHLGCWLYRDQFPGSVLGSGDWFRVFPS